MVSFYIEMKMIILNQQSANDILVLTYKICYSYSIKKIHTNYRRIHLLKMYGG